MKRLFLGNILGKLLMMNVLKKSSKARMNPLNRGRRFLPQKKTDLFVVKVGNMNLKADYCIES
jgi:hypothetical protein